MSRAIIPRLRRLYERLWTTDTLDFLDREITVLRDADARRDAELAALRDELGALRETAAGRDRELATLRDELGALRETAAGRDRELATLRNELGALRETAAGRDRELATLRNELGALRETAAGRDRELATVRDEFGALRETAAGRDRELAALRDELAAGREIAAGRDRNLAALRDELSALRETAAGRDRELAALRDELGALRETAASRDSDAGMVRNAVTALGDRQTELAHRLTTAATREEVDLFKSSLEVPRELRDEFLDWKTHHPVPAQPLVSVCVSTYNRADLLLERCIPSILGQTYDHLELIVVGDGCTDETADRVARLDDPRVQFVNLPARGRYPDEFMRRWMVAGTPAFNRALDLARGDFVTHLDDDDEYHLDRLEKLVAFVTANGCDVAWHPFWWQVQDAWEVNESHEFAYAQVTTSSVFYRAWFTKIQWNIEAHWLGEPGDWNRFRRFKYLGPVMMRYPEPLLRHYRERTQAS